MKLFNVGEKIHLTFKDPQNRTDIYIRAKVFSSAYDLQTVKSLSVVSDGEGLYKNDSLDAVKGFYFIVYSAFQDSSFLIPLENIGGYEFIRVNDDIESDIIEKMLEEFESLANLINTNDGQAV